MTLKQREVVKERKMKERIKQKMQKNIRNKKLHQKVLVLIPEKFNNFQSRYVDAHTVKLVFNGYPWEKEK